MVYYVRVLDVYVTLACVCVCMLSGRGPMDILYALTCYTCIFVCWTGPVVRVRARLVILGWWGALYKLGRVPLYSVGEARYTS